MALKFQKIIMKNGNKAKLPKLDVAEFGFCKDTEELFIGSVGNNIEIVKKSHVDEVQETLNSQFTEIKNEFNKVIFKFKKNENNGYLTASGENVNETGMRCIYTDDIDCVIGDIFLYKGFAEGNAVSCLFKKDDKIISYAKYNSKNTYTEITIPSDINKVVFTSFEYTQNVDDVTFDLIKKTTLEEKVNNIEIESKKAQNTCEYLYQKFDCIKNIVQNYNTTSLYVSKNTGTTVSSSDSKCTDYIECSKKDKFYATGSSQYNTCLVATYNENKKFLRSYGYDSNEERVKFIDFEFSPKDDEKFVRFCSYQDILIVKKSELTSVTEYFNDKTQILFNSNILYGKKYVACGDSFTEGDFSGYVDENNLSGINSPIIYDSELKMYKTYPWWISKRNGMKLINEAKCGSVFTNYKNGEGNPFSVNRYLNVPKDADYVTLMFGLNESELTDAQIGTVSDKTNETLWGAYNMVFEHFLTTMPYAKIGVILSDAWLPKKYADAVVEICKYWGIPYLNLKGDDGITMGIGGKFDSCSQIARDLRNNSLTVSSSNGHPNLEAHKFRSTIIENFLRSL